MKVSAWGWVFAALCDVSSTVVPAAGDVLGDVFEISNIRREDYEFHKGPSEYEDILQSNNLPSSATPRGHQTPAAFLIMTSGLDKVVIKTQRLSICRSLEQNRWPLFECLRSMESTRTRLCPTPTLTSLAPVVLSPESPQEPPLLPWQPTTSFKTASKKNILI